MRPPHRLFLQFAVGETGELVTFFKYDCGLVLFRRILGPSINGFINDVYLAVAMPGEFFFDLSPFEPFISVGIRPEVGVGIGCGYSGFDHIHTLWGLCALRV